MGKIAFWPVLICLVSISCNQNVPEVTPTIKNVPTIAAYATPTVEATMVIPEIPITIIPIITEPKRYMGPLTDLEREILYSTSMSYVADTHLEAISVSETIGVQHPSNLCGPLSATFLISTGILPADTATFDFWFLDPVDDVWRFWTWFPDDRFDRFDFAQRVGTFDFAKFPLYPGDFLYLYASPGGAFDHMLVVTRVDEEGRAYSVTNIRIGDWPDGFGEFVIKEVMLYDPNNPGVGQFAEYNKLNWTGFGWFMYRRK